MSRPLFCLMKLKAILQLKHKLISYSILFNNIREMGLELKFYPTHRLLCVSEVELYY